MDKTEIKKYAVWARNELIERVSQKADQYEISADADPNADSAHGILLMPAEKKQRASLIAKVKDKGMDQVMEEVAYTWFNRFAALRFMEVNNYLSTRVRVFTNEEGAFKPEILMEAIHLDLDGLDMEKVYALKDANDNEALFKYLIITQCNALSSVLPGMFQKIEDYTELLFPDNLLREGSVVEQMITQIPENDWKDQVQIIGWLYQYYNTEPKDKVFADLKKNKKITKEKIPAATQLFTPDWIVRYMVENSLGRLWVEGHPNDDLKANCKYYLEEANQEPDVQKQLDEIKKEYAALTPDQIRAVDPCMGSGHIICYMFDVLMQIYEAYGYTARDAASSVVKNNLYGLDIDDRAAQLAYFAVMMKACQYDRRFLSRGIQPHVYAIMESNRFDSNMIDFFTDGRKELKSAMSSLISDLHDAKEYGSILDVKPVDFPALYVRFDEIRSDNPNLYTYQILDELLPFVQMAETMSQKYHIVCTNPPYMGNGGMSAKLISYINDHYKDGKADLYATFILRCIDMLNKSGRLGMMTSYTWMFLSGYQNVREKVVFNHDLESLIQPEYHSFFEEAYVPICTFVVKNRHTGEKGTFIRLEQFTGATVQGEKALDAIRDDECSYRYSFDTSLLHLIPGAPLVYWADATMFEQYNTCPLIQQICPPKPGLSTGENERFLRFWYEPDFTRISFSGLTAKKWYPINKGGDFRKWYGNHQYLVNWENDGFEIKNFKNSRGKLKSRPQNLQYNFKPAISWSLITTGAFSVRYYPAYFMQNAAGICCYPEADKREYLLGFLNSKPAQVYASMLSPTLNTNAGDIARIPFVFSAAWKKQIDSIVSKCIDSSIADWDSFETSWNFRKHPLIRNTPTIKEAFSQWQQECDERFNQLKANEEELNRIFIDIYGLQDELTPEEDDKDVTVRKADLERDIRSFVSYAVGCMFGRYSLDVDGLAYAGGDGDDAKYKTFMPDKDAILPITDDEYFTDDIVGRFVEFVRTVYGADTLEENLKFIADALEEKGSTSREVIRNYFLNSFYKDHLKTYQKRPIYWLFDSGKKNGFKCLVYMHRYQPDTIARIRTDYVHEQQARYRTAISGLERQINGAPTSERVRLNKLMTKLKDQAEETRLYEEKIHHLADQMIEIDLDDGVKHNYAIFQDVLAKIK